MTARKASQKGKRARIEARNLSTVVLAGVGVVSLVVIGLMLWLITRGQSGPNPGPVPAAPLAAVPQGTTPEGYAGQGFAQAPVIMVEFSDFQCPLSRQFATESLPQIEEKYIKGGLVQLIYVDFVARGPESQWAAEAARCAQEQGRFWDYHDKLFANQAGQNQGAFSKDRLKQFAAELGLEPQAFARCLDSGKYTQAVETATQEGRNLGVRGTPTFFVNGRKVEGPLSFAQWDELFSLYSQELYQK